MAVINVAATYNSSQDVDFWLPQRGLFLIAAFQGSAWGSNFYIADITAYHVDVIFSVDDTVFDLKHGLNWYNPSEGSPHPLHFLIDHNYFAYAGRLVFVNIAPY